MPVSSGGALWLPGAPPAWLAMPLGPLGGGALTCQPLSGLWVPNLVLAAGGERARRGTSSRGRWDLLGQGPGGGLPVAEGKGHPSLWVK